MKTVMDIMAYGPFESDRDFYGVLESQVSFDQYFLKISLSGQTVMIPWHMVQRVTSRKV